MKRSREDACQRKGPDHCSGGDLIPVTCLVDRMKELFEGQRYLIGSLNDSLPMEYKIGLPPEDLPSMKMLDNVCGKYSNRIQREKASFGLDHGVDCSNPNHNKALIKLDKEQRKCAEKERTRKEYKGKRDHDRDARDLDYNSYRDLNNIQHLPHKLKTGSLEKGFLFCAKVKDRNLESYHELLKWFHHYHLKIISKSELRFKVFEILGKYADLLDALPRCEKNFKRAFCNGGHFPIQMKAKVMTRLREHARDDGNNYNDGGEDEDKEWGILDRTEPLGHKAAASHRTPLFSNKEKCISKSIRELDLSKCASHFSSYQFRPKNCPTPPKSQRSELGVEVRNDNWVSKSSKTKDHSFKNRDKSQYEESLFRCEDDRFEMGMLLEYVKVTIKRIEEVLDKINNGVIKPCTLFHIENHLTGLNLKCIERLYGDHGMDVVDMLRKNAALVLPVVLTRLKQKQEEWNCFRSDFNKLWAQIYAENHKKMA